MEPLVRIPVGVVVERSKAASQWIDFTWQAVAVLPGAPDTAAWSVLREEQDRTTFYAGHADLMLHASDSPNYRDNLATGDPALWIVLRRSEAAHPFNVLCVTADGSEAENFTSAGDDIVEQVAMPDFIRDAVEAFVAAHHVERVNFKRQRKPADPDALGRRPHVDKDRE
jgi:hypothetical protein